jgi:alpha-L-arabinofuranosidase
MWRISHLPHEPLDFDEFIACAAPKRRAGHLRQLRLDVPAAQSPTKAPHPRKAQLLEHAVEWVRYANVVKGYGVKYWELGNESYLLGTTAQPKPPIMPVTL